MIDSIPGLRSELARRAGGPGHRQLLELDRLTCSCSTTRSPAAAATPRSPTRCARSARCPGPRTRRRSSGRSSTARCSRRRSTTPAPASGRANPTRRTTRRRAGARRRRRARHAHHLAGPGVRRPDGLQRRRDPGAVQRLPGHRGRPAGQRRQLIEGFIGLTSDPRLVFERSAATTSLGFDQATVAATWYTDQTAQIGQMRSIETQIVDAIVGPQPGA